MSCEYCAGIIDDRPSLIGIDGHEVYIDGYGKLTLEHPSGWCSDREISFCPNCGSPLSDPTPLTLEELRGMDGVPVWIETTRDWLDFHEDCRPFKCWGIVSLFDGHLEFARMGLPLAIDEGNCMEFLRFYTHKPKDREGEG